MPSASRTYSLAFHVAETRAIGIIHGINMRGSAFTCINVHTYASAQMMLDPVISKEE